MRDAILESVYELLNKKTRENIIIESKKLVFENIWHVLINGNKLNKTSDLLISYKCIKCNNNFTTNTTNFLRKIRRNINGCYCCINNMNKKNCSFIEQQKENIIEFDNLDNSYKNSYNLHYLTKEEYNKILPNIKSFSNGSLINITNYEYLPVFKFNNQLKFSPVLYDKTNKTIFKANQPIINCDNCLKDFRAKSLESLKNQYKILCPDCKSHNKILKIVSTKNILNEKVIYSSRLEHKLIKWAEEKNLIIRNCPTYKIDFIINDILIDFKTNKFLQVNNLKYYFITPKNWKEKIKELNKI